jgi:hypothetical protein
MTTVNIKAAAAALGVHFNTIQKNIKDPRIQSCITGYGPHGAIMLDLAKLKRAWRKFYTWKHIRFTDDQIYHILTSSEGHHEIARRYGRSHQNIQQVRYGHSYTTIHPEIPRWNPKEPITCHQCVHWQSETCSMELPEPQQMGPQFARECATFHRDGTASPVLENGSPNETIAS